MKITAKVCLRNELLLLPLYVKTYSPPPANVGDIAGSFLTGVVQMEGELLNILCIREVVELQEA